MPRTTDHLTRVQLLDGVRMTMTSTNGTTAMGLGGAGRSCSSSAAAVHHAAAASSARCSSTVGLRVTGRPQSVRDEIRSLQFYRALIAECLASFLYVFLVCGAHLAWLHPTSKVGGLSPSLSVVGGTATMSIVGGNGVGSSGGAVGRTRSMILDSAAAQHEHHHQQQQQQQQYGLWSVQAALTSGFAMSTAVLCFGRISGGHINPAVTISLMVTRRITPLKAFLYVTAQCGGAIAGAALLQGMSVTGHQAGTSSVRIHDLLTPWQGLGIETILAFAIVFASYASMDFTGCNVLFRTASTPYATVSPLIGVAYLVCTLTGLPSTGAALNPARALGPAFVMNRWANHWVYWLGPVSGGLLAGLIYEYVFDPERADGKEEADLMSDDGGRQLRLDDINRAHSSAHSQDDDYDDPTDVAMTSLPCHQHQPYNCHVVMATMATPPSPPPPPPLPNVSAYRHVPQRIAQQHYDTYRPPSSSHYGVLPRRGENTYGTLACNPHKTGASSTTSSSVNYGNSGLYGTTASHRPPSTASGTYATIHGNRSSGLNGGMSRTGVPSQSLHRLEYDAGGPDSTKF